MLCIYLLIYNFYVINIIVYVYFIFYLHFIYSVVISYKLWTFCEVKYYN